MNHLIPFGRSLGVVTFCLALAASARAMEIRIDFEDGVAGPGGNWNTLASPTDSIANLTDYGTGLGTNIGLDVTQPIGPSSGGANTWTSTPEYRSWIDPAATSDYFFVRTSDFPAGQLTFAGAGLDDNKVYRVEVLGSRSAAGTRRGKITINGSFSDNLNSDGFDALAEGYTAHQVTTWRSVKPVAGEIVLDITPFASNQHGYLSAMRIAEAPEQTVLFDIGDTNRQTSGRWNNVHTANGSGGTGGPGHRVLGAVDAAGQTTSVGLNILQDFGGRNNVGISSDAAGFAATAQSDSFYVGNGDTATLQLEGLTPGAQYDVTLFGSREAFPGDPRAIGLTIGGTSQTLSIDDNASNSVTFAGVAADARGLVRIDATNALGQYGYLGVVEIAGTFGSKAPQPSIYFDFGADNRLTGGNWNNLASANYGAGGTGAADVIGAIDSLGNPTGVNLIVVDDFPGVNATGENSDDAGFPISAQSDSFYLGNGDALAQLRVEGLIPGGDYDITLFGSRQTTGDDRSVVFGIVGGPSATLLNSGNTDQVVTFSMLRPNPDGTLLIDFSRPPGSSFGYFGAMQITQVVPEPSGICLAAAGLVVVLGLGVRSRRRR